MFVPVLAHRFARERLKALAQAEGLVVKELPEVLFVCVQNAGRSQMAAGLVTLRSGGRVHVRSAGSDPAEVVNPLVAEAMAEVGIDLAEAFPKPLTDEVVRAADVVVTMGCGDACPIYPGKRYEDWEVGDPAETEALEDVSASATTSTSVWALLAELEIPGGLARLTYPRACAAFDRRRSSRGCSSRARTRSARARPPSPPPAHSGPATPS